jgi:predicted RNase H-like HicB family nuclease
MPARKKEQSKACFPVVIEKQKTGYGVYCLSLTGCYGHGITYEQALESIHEAIDKAIAKLLASGGSMPNATAVSLAIVEVAV